MAKISRRRLIIAGIGTALLSTYGVYKWKWGNPRDVIISILRRRVGDLRVDWKTFDTFADTYVARHKKHRENLTKASVFSVPLRFATPYPWLSLGHELRRLEDNVVSLYLLSTDFFQNGADERKLVNYVAFYDPQQTPCRNPFALKRA